MTVIADAAPLIAVMDRDDHRRSAVRPFVVDLSEDVVIPAPVTAEIDDLVGQRIGRVARRAFLTDLADGKYRLDNVAQPEYDLILQLDDRYADLDVGLADLSIVVLAHRFRTRRILTFDERHFRTLRPLDGGAFTLLPADEPAPRVR